MDPAQRPAGAMIEDVSVGSEAPGQARSHGQRATVHSGAQPKLLRTLDLLLPVEGAVTRPTLRLSPPSAPTTNASIAAKFLGASKIARGKRQESIASIASCTYRPYAPLVELPLSHSLIARHARTGTDVPTIVLKTCLTKVPLTHQAYVATFDAAVGIVDISGFTALAEHLAGGSLPAVVAPATPTSAGPSSSGLHALHMNLMLQHHHHHAGDKAKLSPSHATVSHRLLPLVKVFV
jgi:hypothetical protein